MGYGVPAAVRRSVAGGGDEGVSRVWPGQRAGEGAAKSAPAYMRLRVKFGVRLLAVDWCQPYCQFPLEGAMKSALIVLAILALLVLLQGSDGLVIGQALATCKSGC